MKVSIIIPTIRPKTIAKFAKRVQETTKDIDYELIVVSPCNLDLSSFKNTIFIKEEKKSNKYIATIKGIEASTGDYLITQGDYFFYETDTIKNLVENFEKKGLALSSPRINDFYCVHPDCTLYGFYYMRLPFISREWAEKIGGFMDPYYQHFYGDIDITMRVLQLGGKVEICQNSFVEVCETEDEDIKDTSLPSDSDCIYFNDKWNPIFNHRENFADIKDFNLKSNEKTNRVVTEMRRGRWEDALKELSSDCMASEEFFPILLPYIFFMWNIIPSEFKKLYIKEIFKELAKNSHCLNYQLTLNKLGRQYKNFPEYCHEFLLNNSDSINRSIDYKMALLTITGLIMEKINRLQNRNSCFIRNFYNCSVDNLASLNSHISGHYQSYGVQIKIYSKEIEKCTNIDELSDIDFDLIHHT